MIIPPTQRRDRIGVDVLTSIPDSIGYQTFDGMDLVMPTTVILSFNGVGEAPPRDDDFFNDYEPWLAGRVGMFMKCPAMIDLNPVLQRCTVSVDWDTQSNLEGDASMENLYLNGRIIVRLNGRKCTMNWNAYETRRGDNRMWRFTIALAHGGRYFDSPIEHDYLINQWRYKIPLVTLSMMNDRLEMRFLSGSWVDEFEFIRRSPSRTFKPILECRFLGGSPRMVLNTATNADTLRTRFG